MKPTYAIYMAEAGKYPGQELRKAKTRKKILDAANELFDKNGYEKTSIEEIAREAGVSQRTLYVRFESKASMLLAYFDDWMDAFIAEIKRRPIQEPVSETVRRALETMAENGWVDRVEDPTRSAHPLVRELFNGPPEIAGHVLQRWMRVQAELSNDAINRGGYKSSSLEPRARAVGVFAAWIATIAVAGDRETGSLPSSTTGNNIGISIIDTLTRGRV